MANCSHVHKMFTYTIKQSEFLRLCVCVCCVGVCVGVMVCVRVFVIILFVWLKYPTPVFLCSTCCEVV